MPESLKSVEPNPLPVPAVLLTRCPGCASALKPGHTTCGYCSLGVAGVAGFWSRSRTATGHLRNNLIAGLIAAACTLAIVAVVVLLPTAPRLFALFALSASLAGAVLAGLLLQPWVSNRLRRASSWTFSTEWSSDNGHGYAQATVHLEGDRVRSAAGQFREYAQPTARRAANRLAPLSSQRRFVRWLTGETIAGRTRVAALHRIEWELAGAGSSPPPEPTRTEERKLMVAADRERPPTESGEEARVYSTHLAEPRPVSELWFELSRRTEHLPGVETADFELPEWAVELEAALTAEVAPLVLN